MWNVILILSSLLTAVAYPSGQPQTQPSPSSGRVVSTAAKQPGQVGARPGRATILKAQEALVQAGTLKTKPNGHLNLATRAAIRLYQKKNALKVTGTLTAETLQYMGIAADTTAHK